MDRPLFKVLTDSVLLDIARNVPEKDVDLVGLGLSPRQIHMWGDQILAAAKRGVDAPLVEREQLKRPNDAVVRRVEKLKTWRKKLAEEMKVESDIILPKTYLALLSESPPKTMDELKSVMARSPHRFEKYGDQIYRLIGG
jgi:ribonuclease D